MSCIMHSTLVDPRTVMNIKAQRPGTSSSPSRPYPCGCHTRTPSKWFLCDYHEGFDAALDIYGDMQ